MVAQDPGFLRECVCVCACAVCCLRLCAWQCVIESECLDIFVCFANVSLIIIVFVCAWMHPVSCTLI